MKHCKGCNRDLPLKSFGKSGQKKNNGRRYKCNECRRKRRSEKRAENNTIYIEYEHRPDVKRRDRNCRLKREYGITIEEFEQMEKDQDYKCKICKKPENHKTKKHLTVDHCHDTMKVRGLLCHRCNCAIGLLYDDINLFKQTINYLKENEK